MFVCACVVCVCVDLHVSPRSVCIWKGGVNPCLCVYMYVCVCLCAYHTHTSTCTNTHTQAQAHT